MRMLFPRDRAQHRSVGSPSDFADRPRIYFLPTVIQLTVFDNRLKRRRSCLRSLLREDYEFYFRTVNFRTVHDGETLHDDLDAGFGRNGNGRIALSYRPSGRP